MSDVVELGLRRPGAAAAASAPASTAAAAAAAAPVSPAAGSGSLVKGVVEAFLRVFSDSAPDADAKDVKEFAAALQDFRQQVALSDHDQETRRLAASAVRVCEQFLKRSRHYYATREEELAEMITILRKTTKHLAGDSTEFGAQIRATTDRFRGMAQLDDIREVKRQLTEEANVLQKTVEEKMKRDGDALSALTEKVETLQANLVQAEEQASLDALTKISNRGTFDRALAKMVKNAKAKKVALSLAMLDIDHFKKINDEHGHPIGDRVLLCAAQWLTAAVRHHDVVARYGGEEFAVILADADQAAAEKRFTAVLHDIAGRSFEYELDGVTKCVRFTASCGVSQLTGSDTEQDLVQRADQALYEAKRQGRNRVVSKKRSMLGGLFG